MAPLFFLILLALMFFLPKKILAQEQVVLNEMLPQPSSGSDWIELYNPKPFEVDLSGYKILDTAQTPVKTISSDTKIPEYGFLFFDVGTRLNKGGDTIKFIDGQGNVLDEFSYSQSTVDQSYARVPDGTGNWVTQSPTKGFSNGQSSQSTSPPSTSSQTGNFQIKIWEVMANPSSGEEWIELYNAGNSQANLPDWKIDDIQGGGGSPKKFSADIPAGSYFVLYFSSGFFNNDKDNVRLLSQDESEVDRFSYQETEKGLSWAYDGSSWVLTQTSTPGSKNIISTPVVAKEEKKSEKESKETKEVVKKEEKTSKTGRTTKTKEEEESILGSQATAPSLSSPAAQEPESSPQAATYGLVKNRWFFIPIILAGFLIIAAGVRLWLKKG